MLPSNLLLVEHLQSLATEHGRSCMNRSNRLQLDSQKGNRHTGFCSTLCLVQILRMGHVGLVLQCYGDLPSLRNAAAGTWYGMTKSCSTASPPEPLRAMFS